MASEVGVLPIPPESVAKKGRLQPGRMFLVDFSEGRIVDDTEIKKRLSESHPYGTWLQEQKITLEDLPTPTYVGGFVRETLLTRQQCLGYTTEDLIKLLVPMATNGMEAIGSMGNDAALACLSDQPRMLYDYFKQSFAQVTNPPLDSDKEYIVMSLECYIGPERNLLEATPEHCHRLLIQHPILTNEELAQLKEMNHRGWKTKVIDTVFDRAGGDHAMQSALDRICAETTQGHQGWLQSCDPLRPIDGLRPSRDPRAAGRRGGAPSPRQNQSPHRASASSSRPAKPAKFTTTRCSSATVPTRSTLTSRLKRSGNSEPRKRSTLKTIRPIVKNYIKAVDKGLLKVMSKMGISTLAVLQGRADLRSGRPQRRSDRPLLRRHLSKVDGVGPGRACPGSDPPARNRLPGPRMNRNRCPCSPAAANISGAKKANATSSPPK